MEKNGANNYVTNFQKIPYYPVSFKSGSGAILYDDNGKQYID